MAIRAVVVPLPFLAACAAGVVQDAAAAGPWPEQEALFRGDPRWLGGDAVYSVDLGGERVLWLFGDSFVARDDVEPRGDRARTTMVRNTIAVQQGLDPARATLRLHWRRAGNGDPLPFFAGDGEIGIWPLHGVRLPGGALLLFQTRVRSTPGQGLGFAVDGWQLAVIDDPDAPPGDWQPRVLRPPPLPFPAVLGTAVWRDGDHVMMLGSNGAAWHPGILARCAIADLLRGEFSLQWWDGERFTATASLRGPPAVVLPAAGPEASLHRLDDGRWLHCSSRGFGATTIAFALAAAPSGPWSAPRDVYRPPESDRPRAFVYAGKAHPELRAGPGWLAVTYAANAWEFGDLFTPAGRRELYWPRCVRVPLPAP